MTGALHLIHDRNGRWLGRELDCTHHELVLIECVRVSRAPAGTTLAPGHRLLIPADELTAAPAARPKRRSRRGRAKRN